MQKINWNRVILGGLLAGAGTVIGAWLYKEPAAT